MSTADLPGAGTALTSAKAEASAKRVAKYFMMDVDKGCTLSLEN